MKSHQPNQETKTHLQSIPPPTLPSRTAMGIAFDYAPDRPERIDRILNGLDRYNPEKTTVFQDYVTQQCEDRTYDCYANLALLKLWVWSFKSFWQVQERV